MRISLPMLSFLLSLTCAGQTGPGGIGTSTNNVLWLDANYGVTHLLNLVSAWADRSGNGNNAVLPATIPTALPLRVINSVNGYPCLRFDGIDDQLWVADNNNIDLTQWHFFIVHTADVQKDYNAWMVKGDDGNENWELLSYSDGNIHAPIYFTDATRTFPSSAAGQVVTGTFDIFEYSYSTAVGRDVYKNASTIITDNESKTPQTNNRPLFIGNERSTTGRCASGRIAEVIAYNAPLNGAQRIVLNNYLAAKYDRSLGANDIFVQDNSANGNFDHDLAGIGRVNATNQQTDSRGSGIVEISKAAYAGLDDNEFLIWAHNGLALGTFGVGDRPTGVQGRWARVWRVNEVSGTGTAVDVGNVDITFDLAGLGSVTASDLRLLVDANNDGVFANDATISGATHVSGSLYRFSNRAELVNNRRFTLGTINSFNTPLPIELVSFTATPAGDGTVRTAWATASEHNNDHFTVERSVNANEWQVVAQVDAMGNSTQLSEYTAMDATAPRGIAYYRLRQTDVDGAFTLSEMVAVDLSAPGAIEPWIYPDPNVGAFNVRFPVSPSGPVAFALLDPMGRKVAGTNGSPVASGTFAVDLGTPAPGLYHLSISSENLTLVRPVMIGQ